MSCQASRVLMPIRWSAGQLISTTATNPDATWAAGTYTEGARVTHAISYDGATVPHQFESLVAGNTATPGADPTAWLDLGPANTVAMFDPLIRRQAPRTWPLIARKTRHTGSLQVVVQPAGRFHGVGLFGLEGNTLTLELLDELGAVAYSEERSLLWRPDVVGMLSYLETPWTQLDRAVFVDLPAYLGYRLRITVDAGEGEAAIGGLSYGRLMQLGDSPDYGATWQLDTYVRPERDDFGNFLGLIEDAPFSDLVNVTLQFDNGLSASLRQTFAELIYQPTVWLLAGGVRAHEPFLLVLGIFTTPGVTISYPTHDTLSLQVMGVT